MDDKLTSPEYLGVRSPYNMAVIRSGKNKLNKNVFG